MMLPLLIFKRCLPMFCFILLVLNVIQTFLVKLYPYWSQLISTGGSLGSCHHSLEGVDVFETDFLLVFCETDPEWLVFVWICRHLRSSLHRCGLWSVWSGRSRLLEHPHVGNLNVLLLILPLVLTHLLCRLFKWLASDIKIVAHLLSLRITVIELVRSLWIFPLITE